MLAANVCAAEYLTLHTQPALFRVHEGPPPDKLAALRAIIGRFPRDLKRFDRKFQPVQPEPNSVESWCRIVKNL